MQFLGAVGIPKSRCLLDYGGRRTLDSVIRARDVFGKNKYIIVSQEFHNRRALYIALHNDIDAVAYDAIYPIYKKSIKVKVREMFARVKVVADIILGVKPHFTT
ncbi:MAG: YdcF family protein [Bacteroidaceae bacterium]|nr:YdcF family protein [Bacteroidaceae bacterium]